MAREPDRYRCCGSRDAFAPGGELCVCEEVAPWREIDYVRRVERGEPHPWSPAAAPADPEEYEALHEATMASIATNVQRLQKGFRRATEGQ